MRKVLLVILLLIPIVCLASQIQKYHKVIANSGVTDPCSSYIVDDSFDESGTTALESHTPTPQFSSGGCGTDWSEAENWETTGISIDSSDRAYAESSTTPYATVVTATPSSANHWVKISGSISAADSPNLFGVILRGEDNTSSAEDYIHCRVQGNVSGTFYLLCFAYNNGTETQIGSSQDCGTRTPGTGYRVYGSASGISPNITVTAWMKNDAETTTYCSLSQGSVTGPDSGSVGVYIERQSGDSTYIYWITSGYL